MIEETILNKEMLYRKVAGKTGVSYGVVRKICFAFLCTIKEELPFYDKIELKSFGTFRLKRIERKGTKVLGTIMDIVWNRVIFNIAYAWKDQLRVVKKVKTPNKYSTKKGERIGEQEIFNDKK